MTKLIDNFNRHINYLRISVTDRCNLRCVYCMPKEGMSQIGHEDVLRYEEILKITKIAAKKGISKIRITGGEPLVRKNIINLISDINNITYVYVVIFSIEKISSIRYVKSVEGGCCSINSSVMSIST